MVPFLAVLLDDPYAAVRFNAFRSLRTSPTFADLDYDYVADPALRHRVESAVLASWRSEDRLDRPLLLTTDGRLDTAAVASMEQRRDDRPVDIAE